VAKKLLAGEGLAYVHISYNIPGSHFFSVIVDLAAREILLYDFLNGANNRSDTTAAFHSLSMDLIEEYLNHDIRCPHDWTRTIVVQQGSDFTGTECGIVVIVTSWMLVRLRRPPSPEEVETACGLFNAMTMTAIRNWLAFSILRDNLWFPGQE
jgi:hypothetical protein